jgi:preprotein translocase subunit SecA
VPGVRATPGESRFYLSLGDDLMRLFNADAVERIMTRLRVPEDIPIEHKLVSKAVANAQAQVESRNFDIRKNVLKYDDVLNKQRQVVYTQRQTLLDGDPGEVEHIAMDYIEEAIRAVVDLHAPPGWYAEDWDLGMLQTDLEQIYPTRVEFDQIDLELTDREELIEQVIDDAFDVYEERESEVGAEVIREVERRVILTIVDRKWREHLYEMDALRDGIGLRAVGQRDPLVEYQREAYDSFSAMMEAIRHEAAAYFFNVPIEKAAEEDADTPRRQAAKLARQTISRRPEADGEPGDEPSVKLPDLPDGGDDKSFTYVSGDSSSPRSYTAAGGAQPSRSGDDGVVKTAEGRTIKKVQAGGQASSEKVGRNDPCPCGSGNKYKRCHGA